MHNTYLSPSESRIRVYARHVCKHSALLKNEPAFHRQDIDEFTNYLHLVFNLYAKRLNAPKRQTVRSVS